MDIDTICNKFLKSVLIDVCKESLRLPLTVSNLMYACKNIFEVVIFMSLLYYIFILK